MPTANIMGVAVLHGFHMVVEICTETTRVTPGMLPPSISTTPNSARGVGKGQRGSDELRTRQRQGLLVSERSSRIGAAGCSYLVGRGPGFEGAHKRLHGEWHGVDQRAHHEAGKGEQQIARPMACVSLPMGPLDPW